MIGLKYYPFFAAGETGARRGQALKVTQLKSGRSQDLNLGLSDWAASTLDHLHWRATSYAWCPAQITFTDNNHCPLGIRATAIGRGSSVSPRYFYMPYEQGDVDGLPSGYIVRMFGRATALKTGYLLWSRESRFVCCPYNKVNASFWDKCRTGLFMVHRKDRRF